MFATLAGAYPWPGDLPPAAALEAVIDAQVEAGLGLLSDGRVHVAAASTAASTAGELVDAWNAAREAGARRAPEMPVKIAVAGPWSVGGPDGALDAGRRLNGAILALAEAGCPVVEIHEPAAPLPADDAGRRAFAAAHAAVFAGAPEGIHASLAITGGDATTLGPGVLFAAPYRSHLFDVLDGPESWRLIAVAPGERGIVVGVGDATGRRRTRLEEIAWAASYAASTRGRGMDRVGVAPSGSLAALAPGQARAVIDLLGEAATVIAGGREELLRRLDPRAIDARSAALGQYRPPRRRARGS